MRKDRKKRLRRIAEKILERRRGYNKECAGTLRMTQSGYGFVTLESDGSNSATLQDVFIPAKFVGDALDGDYVSLTIIPPRKNHPEDQAKGPVGRINSIIKRERTEFVGELLAGSMVMPLNPRLPDAITIHGARRGAARGDWVRVKLENRNGRWDGTVREVLGRAGVIAADLDAVMADFDLAPRYTEKEEEAAQEIVPRDIERKDHTGLFTVTVDPFDAKDFDDALSIVPGKKKGTAELGIHIADVAAFIAPKSKFDDAARLRAFSCYLPGRTLPMLPTGLTAKISMQENQRSLAHSVFLTVDLKTGEILSGRREHTFITVDRRLNYDEVQNFIDSGKAPRNWDENLRVNVKALVEVTGLMRKYREQQEKFIELPLPEIRVVCDEQKNIISGLVSKISRESESLVEECMLAANQFIGNLLVERSVAGIYRVHPIPDAEKTFEFADMMQENFNLTAGDKSNRKVCRDFIASLPDDGLKNVILGLLLRAMPRASYSVKPEIHFALGKSRYCHFTSPIRRYTDLIVHQQLWNMDCKIRTRSSRTLETAAAWCSEQEEVLDAAYYAASDRMKLRYLAEELERDASKIYEAVAVRTLAAGLQVDIPELGLYGFIPKSRMRGGDFRRRKYALSDRRENTIYRPGNYLYVRIDSIEFARGTVNVLPVGR